MEGTRASTASVGRRPFMPRKRLHPTAAPCNGFVVNFSAGDEDELQAEHGLEAIAGAHDRVHRRAE